MSRYMELPPPLWAKLERAVELGILSRRDVENTADGMVGGSRYSLGVVGIEHDPGCRAVLRRDLRFCSCPEPFVTVWSGKSNDVWANHSDGWQHVD